MLLARQRGVTQMSPVHLKKAPLAGIAPALATAVLATARLAQLVERKALNLVVVGSILRFWSHRDSEFLVVRPTTEGELQSISVKFRRMR